jgi:hypothetical protein
MFMYNLVVYLPMYLVVLIGPCDKIFKSSSHINQDIYLLNIW